MIHHHLPTRARRAFSLVETTIAVVLVGGVYVVALNLVGASQVTQARYTDREQGLLLAETLLNEVLALPYEEPDDPGSVLGLELNETAADRTTFDDVDDYAGWSSNPLVDADGNDIDGTDRFTRSVDVHWVELAAPRTTAAAESGLKRVSVAVSIGNKKITQIVGFTADDWPVAAQMVDAP